MISIQMTAFNNKQAEEANKRTEKALADHLAFIELSRASMEDALAMEQIIKHAQTRISRYIAMHKLNIKLNKLREAIANSEDPASTDNSRPALMKIAVDAGLPLQRASECYNMAVKEGEETRQTRRLERKKSDS